MNKDLTQVHRVCSWAAVALLFACANAGESAEEVIWFGHSSGGPAPLTVGLTIREDRSVSCGSTGDEQSCDALTIADYCRLNDAIEKHLDLLGAVSVANYTDTFFDHEEVTFLFPRKLESRWRDREVTVPVILFPVRLVPLVEEMDRLGREACGREYRKVAPRLRLK